MPRHSHLPNAFQAYNPSLISRNFITNVFALYFGLQRRQLDLNLSVYFFLIYTFRCNKALAHFLRSDSFVSLYLFRKLLVLLTDLDWARLRKATPLMPIKGTAAVV